MKNDSKSDIPDRQLPTVDTPHNESEWTEIGKAEITQSIFGKAKVRIIRQPDKARRAWLLTALVVLALMVALSAILWQLRSDPQTNGVAQSPEPVMRVTTSPEPDMVAPPALPPPTSAVAITANTQHRVIPHNASGVPANGAKSAPPASGVKHAEVMAGSPAPPQVPMVGNPHPVSTNAMPAKSIQTPLNKPGTVAPTAIPVSDAQLSAPINAQSK